MFGIIIIIIITILRKNIEEKEHLMLKL